MKLGRLLGDPSLHVDKIPVPAELSLEGGVQLLGNIHVFKNSPYREGAERIFDVLAGSEPFLPITAAPDGETTIVRKAAIVLVRVGDPEDTGIVELASEEVPEMRVEVEVSSRRLGSPRLCGTLKIVMPVGHTRLVDFMNAAGPYIPLITDQGPVIVATRHITCIREV